MTNTQRFAELELNLLSQSAKDPNNRPVIEPFKKEILALCEAFGGSGQSGGSAPMTATALSQAIKKLLLQEPILPMTGLDDEWMEVSEYNGNHKKWFQNKRCSALFKDSSSNSSAYYLDAIVWKGDTVGESGNSWDTFSGTVEGITSRQRIKSFPFTPKTFYIDVTREILPNDWMEEPFIEWKFYDTKEYEKTGIKKWQTGKYRYLIKDINQLKRVWKYYNKY